MASPGVFAALAFAIIVIALWAGWVVRTGRAGSHVRALPVLVLLLVAIFEALAIRVVLATPDGPASEKTSLLAEHISRGMRYFACAWGSVGIALVVLAVFSLRRPRDADAPTARVIRSR